MTVSRTKLLTGSAALVAAPALIIASASAAGAASADDIAALNGAIALELAGIKAYTDAAKLNLLTPPVLAVAKSFIGDHQAHVSALSAAVKDVGGTPTTTPAKLPYPTLKTQADILAFAEKVERIAVADYLSSIGKMSDPKHAQLMASILGVEATHVTTLAAALNQGKPYPAFVN
jgi:rubrerythrin